MEQRGEIKAQDILEAVSEMISSPQGVADDNPAVCPVGGSTCVAARFQKASLPSNCLFFSLTQGFVSIVSVLSRPANHSRRSWRGNRSTSFPLLSVKKLTESV